MSNRPLFSVIIPLYNKEPHIKRTLLSVLAQTETDYEIIVVDDCSTDNGPEIAEKTLFGTPCRYRIVSRSERGGSVAPPRNTGVRHAVGNMVAFLDADDEWMPNFLKELKGLRKKFPAAQAYGCAREVHTGNGIVRDKYHAQYATRGAHTIDLEQYLHARIHVDNPFRVPTVAFKPEALDDIGGFVHAPRSSDIDLMFRFFLRGKKAAWSPYIGVRIHRVPGSVMTQTELQQTRPWFYTARKELESGTISASLARDIKCDITRRKVHDMKDALTNGALRFAYWNNVYFIQSPFWFTLLFTATLLPKKGQLALSHFLEALLARNHKT